MGSSNVLWGLERSSLVWRSYCWPGCYSNADPKVWGQRPTRGVHDHGRDRDCMREAGASVELTEQASAQL
jgi:hypothetical protein